jgi:hypothetical protein
MTPTQPQFIATIPAEIGRHGPGGAVLVAHIAFRCTTPRQDRIEDETGRWWRVSYRDLGREVEMSPSTVRRAMEKLIADGAVEAKHFPPLEDQTLAYRANNRRTDDDTRPTDNGQGADLPEYEFVPAVSSQNTNSAPTVSDSAPPRVESDICTTSQEGEEGGEARARPPSPNSANGKPANGYHLGPYGPRCKAHINDPNPPSCHGCKLARLAYDAEQTQQATATAAEVAEINAEIAACTYCGPTGMTDDQPAVRCTRHRQLSDIRRAAS